MRMITLSCALLLGGASFVLPMECRAGDGLAFAAEPVQKVAAATPRKAIPRQDIVRASRPSPSHMNMVTINPGTVKMGSPRNEHKRQRFEGPQVEVTIPYRFEVGKYEVTFNEWNQCVAAGGCRGYRPDDKGWGRGNRPVVNISYNDAQSYIRWLNKKTGLNYRLLSEAEWEYIAKAGQDVPLATGHTISAKYANFDGANPYGTSETGPYYRKTVPVGSYAPNAFGLHDIHGNVYEWVEDCWNPDHQGRPLDGSARKDGDCNYRIMKGGSWVTHGYQMRTAARIRYVKDYRYDDYGFRIARTLK